MAQYYLLRVTAGVIAAPLWLPEPLFPSKHLRPRPWILPGRRWKDGGDGPRGISL